MCDSDKNSIRTQVLAKRNIWETEFGYQQNIEKAMCRKESRNTLSRSLPRPYILVSVSQYLSASEFKGKISTWIL